MTNVTQDGIWTVSCHPSPPSQLGPGNVPYVLLTTPYPRQQHDTFAFPPPSSILTLIKKNTPLSLNRITEIPTTIYQQENCTLKLSQLNFSSTPICTPMILGQGLKIKSSTWFAMGIVGPLTQTVFWELFSFGFFSWIFFLRGWVLAGWSPEMSTSFPPIVTAVIIALKDTESPERRRARTPTWGCGLVNKNGHVRDIT